MVVLKKVRREDVSFETFACAALAGAAEAESSAVEVAAFRCTVPFASLNFELICKTPLEIFPPIPEGPPADTLKLKWCAERLAPG
jgi:hypothetical protein